MQRIRTLIRPVQLRPLPVHAVSHQPRCNIEWIPFIRPPPVYTHGEIFAVLIPVATGLRLIELRELALIPNFSVESVRQNYRVENSVKILRMQLIEDFLGIGKHPGIPHEGPVLGVPT